MESILFSSVLTLHPEFAHIFRIKITIKRVGCVEGEGGIPHNLKIELFVSMVRMSIGSPSLNDSTFMYRDGYLALKREVYKKKIF